MPDPGRRHCRRDRRFRRHQRPVAHLCGANRHPGRSQPGDGRAWRRQPRRRLLPGLPDQQQLVAHAGRRGRGREDAADRRRRRAGRRAGDRRRSDAVPGSALLRRSPRWSSPPRSACSSSRDLARIYRIQQWEFWLSILCTVGVAVFGAIPGIGIAIVARGHRIPVGRLAAALGGAGQAAKASRATTTSRAIPMRSRIPGLVLFRWDAPLFFANAELFSERVLDAIAASPTPVRRVVVAAEPITSVDVTSADALAELDQTLKASGYRALLRRAEGPGEGQAQALRPARRVRREPFLPDEGIGREQLPEGLSAALLNNLMNTRKSG